MAHCAPKPLNCISMLFNWAYQRSPNPPKAASPPLNPRCLFSLSVLKANGFTSNNSAAFAFLPAVPAKQAAASPDLHSCRSRTSSRSLSLQVRPRSGRRTHNERSASRHGKNIYFQMNGNAAVAPVCPVFLFSVFTWD